jgi:hypothetical protein
LECGEEHLRFKAKWVNSDKAELWYNHGEHRWSDYDLLVLKCGIDSRRAVAHQIYRALVDIPAAIDVLVETPEKLEQYRSTPGLIYREAVQGMVIYER